MSDGSGDHHLGHAVDVAIEALKALLLLNGGAATAFIALTGKGQGSIDYSVSVLAFGIGAWLTVLAFAAAYFSQLSYANYRFLSECQKNGVSTEQYKWHGRWQITAFIFAALGLIASSYGMFAAIKAQTLI